MTKQQKSKRTQIKDLTMSQQEMSSAEMAQVKGGAGQTALGGGITGAQASVTGTTPPPTLITKKEIIATKPIHSEQEAR